MLLGLPASTGVAYGLVRRAREILWVIPGLVFLVHRPATRRPDEGDDAEPEPARSEQAR